MVWYQDLILVFILKAKILSLILIALSWASTREINRKEGNKMSHLFFCPHVYLFYRHFVLWLMQQCQLCPCPCPCPDSRVFLVPSLGLNLNLSLVLFNIFVVIVAIVLVLGCCCCCYCHLISSNCVTPLDCQLWTWFQLH